MFRRTLLSLAPVAPLLVSAAGAASKPEEAVLAAERDWSAGIVKSDYSLLDKALADDLTYTHSTGEIDTKASYIEKLRNGKSRYYVADYVGDVRVQLLSKDTALTFGKLKVESLGPNNTRSKPTLAFLHAFVKRNGRWQMVAHQSAKIA